MAGSSRSYLKRISTLKTTESALITRYVRSLAGSERDRLLVSIASVRGEKSGLRLRRRETLRSRRRMQRAARKRHARAAGAW